MAFREKGQLSIVTPGDRHTHKHAVRFVFLGFSMAFRFLIGTDKLRTATISKKRCELQRSRADGAKRVEYREYRSVIDSGDKVMGERSSKYSSSRVNHIYIATRLRG